MSHVLLKRWRAQCKVTDSVMWCDVMWCELVRWIDPQLWLWHAFVWVRSARCVGHMEKCRAGSLVVLAACSAVSPGWTEASDAKQLHHCNTGVCSLPSKQRRELQLCEVSCSAVRCGGVCLHLVVIHLWLEELCHCCLGRCNNFLPCVLMGFSVLQETRRAGMDENDDTETCRLSMYHVAESLRLSLPASSPRSLLTMTSPSPRTKHTTVFTGSPWLVNCFWQEKSWNSP